MSAFATRFPALVAAVVALGVHATALGGGFVHDDRPQIANNPLVAGLGALPTLWSTGVWVGAGSGSSFYRPVMMTSFALDAAILGRSPLPMHAMQVLLFAALVAVAARLAAGLSRDARVGLVAALALAVHPVNVEAVAWISARCEILAALFVVLALAARARRLDDGAGGAAASGAPEALAFFLALASKESALVALAPLVALDRLRRASFRPGAVAVRFAPAALALVAYGTLRTRALGSLGGGLFGASDPLAVVAAFGQGAIRLLLPFDLSIAPAPPGALDTLAGAALAVAGAAALARLWLRPAPALLPLTLGLAFLAAGAGGAARIGELADRYLLLPSFAAGWLAALGARSLAPRFGRWPYVALAAAGAACAMLSVRHVPVYESDLALWSRAAETNPASGRATLNLANALLEAGDVAGARAWLDRAAAIDPEDRLLRLNRAVIAAETGDTEDARRLLGRLVAEDPGDWPAQLRLAHLELEAGAADTAAGRYEAVLRKHGLSAEAWAGLGVARARQGRREDARAALQRALALDPGVQNAEMLRRLLARLDAEASK